MRLGGFFSGLDSRAPRASSRITQLVHVDLGQSY
jgi:hypothetical protein